MARTILGHYSAYHFKDHDPVLDKISRLYELAGMTKANGRPDLKKVSYKTGVPGGTLARWENRHVKRPQHPTVQAVVRGLGGKYEIVLGNVVISRAAEITRKDVIARRTAARIERERALASKSLRRVGRGKNRRKAA